MFLIAESMMQLLKSGSLMNEVERGGNVEAIAKWLFYLGKCSVRHVFVCVV